MSVEALFVDWDGTLSHSKFWADCPPDVLDPEMVERFTSFLFKGSHDIVQQWMKGAQSTTAVVGMLAIEFGLDAHTLHSQLERSCRAMQFAHPAVPDQVRRLREQGIKVVIATDNMATFNDWTVPALGLRSMFDGILNSCQQGAFKKDIVDGRSPFFDDYLHQHGLRSGETVLIDDSPHNAVVTQHGMGFRQVTPTSPIEAVLDSFITR